MNADGLNDLAQRIKARLDRRVTGDTITIDGVTYTREQAAQIVPDVNVIDYRRLISQEPADVLYCELRRFVLRIEEHPVVWYDGGMSIENIHLHKG